jgi:hypothetical protein
LPETLLKYTNNLVKLTMNTVEPTAADSSSVPRVRAAFAGTSGFEASDEAGKLVTDPKRLAKRTQFLQVRRKVVTDPKRSAKRTQFCGWRHLPGNGHAASLRFACRWRDEAAAR